MVVVIDTREQKPYRFRNIPNSRAEARRGNPTVKVETVRAGLRVGDYSCQIDDGVFPVAIERKTKEDLYQTLTRGRKRFGRELDLAKEMGISLHLVVESDWNGLLIPPQHPQQSQVKPITIIRSVESLSVKRGLHVWTPGSRAFAESLTYQLLRFAWQDWENKQEKDSNEQQ